MDRNSVDWKGNLCAVVTPFTATGEVDARAFAANLELLMSEGIDGFVVAGCTGEFWALSDPERVELFRLAREVAGGKVPVIGNCSAIVTAHAIALARAALETGLDGIMLTPPYYATPAPREVVAHFQAVSDAVEIPILLYNIPRRQGINLSMDTIVELAAVPNVVAFKQSTGDFMEVVETIRRVSGSIRILAGHSVDRGLPAVVMGSDGYISSVEPQAVGAKAIRLYQLAATGRIAEARALQMQLIELDHAIHGGVGTFPASLKAVMNLRGRPGGYPRPPLLPLTTEQLTRLEPVLGKLGLL